VRREPLFRHTTILCVRRDGTVALGGDGQVTMGTTVVKHGASKIRRLLDGKILAGFAGSTADAITLFTRFERKLEEFHGQLERAAVELATDWRMEKTLRQLEALLIVADAKTSLLLSGTGDVIAPDEGVLAVGSGGPYADAAARALLRHSTLDAAAVVKEALLIAASIDVYTNDAIRIETLP
jgi:ATP-dependent HslUV protease subunit HslV